MKIIFIGAGNIGAALVKQLVHAGHQVSLTARDGATGLGTVIAPTLIRGA